MQQPNEMLGQLLTSRQTKSQRSIKHKSISLHQSRLFCATLKIERHVHGDRSTLPCNFSTFCPDESLVHPTSTRESPSLIAQPLPTTVDTAPKFEGTVVAPNTVPTEPSIAADAPPIRMQPQGINSGSRRVHRESLSVISRSRTVESIPTKPFDIPAIIDLVK